MSQLVAFVPPTNAPIAATVLYSKGQEPSRGFASAPNVSQKECESTKGYVKVVLLTWDASTERPFVENWIRRVV